MKKTTQKFWAVIILLTALFSGISEANAQLMIANGQTITEDFNGIGTAAAATLPASWKADRLNDVRTVGTYAAADAATQYRAGNNMSGTATNGIYNYGAGDPTSATDRAVGFISSGSATKSGNLYTRLENNGAANINYLTISFDIEKYRKGTRTEGFSVQMYYSLDGNTWTDAGTDFLVSFPGGDAANEGYASAPGEILSVTDKDLNVLLNPGGSLYIAWNYSVTSGTLSSNAQGLGIDNIVIEAASASTADDATLSALASAIGVLNPVFNPMTTIYTVQLPFGTTATPTVTATPSNPLANVTITPAADVTSATQTDRTTTVEVISEDLTETKTYTIEFNVPATPSDDASLSSILAEVGSLSPTFSASVFYYNVQLPYGVINTPLVTAATNYSFAVATVTPATDVNSTDSLERTTEIVVVAEDGVTTETYLVQFNPTILTVIDVADMAALRGGATDGTLYRLTSEAVLTYKQTYRNQKFVQDATAAIMIDDFSNLMNTPYNIGDGITNMIGSLQLYNNMLQFIPEINPGAPSSVGNIIVAQTKTVSQITSNDQAKLLRVMNANFPSAVDTFNVNKSYNLTDATGTIVFRTAFHEADYIGSIVPTYLVNVTGILHQYINTLNYTARNAADIELASSVNDMLPAFVFEAYPNPSSDAIIFSFEMPNSQAVALSIHDVNGKQIFNYENTLAEGSQQIIWADAASTPAGIYFYTFRASGQAKNGKLIITN